MSNALVHFKEVTKQFGNGAPALDNVSGEILQNRVTGLVGPDGAGKTTLIRLMTGLMLPESGTLNVLGVDTRRDPAAIQAAIGYMPQRFGLYEDLTVEENLELYADLRGLPPSQRRESFDELLTMTDLARFTGRLAGKLSGGMKQKLGLACALLRKPKLLLLDEPGVGVDPIARRELWKMVQGLVTEDVGVLWSTAYLDEAELCDQVLLLNEGKLLFSGPPSELTSRVEGRVFKVSGIGTHRRPILASLLDRSEVVDGVVQGKAIRLVMAAGATVPRDIIGPNTAITTIPGRFEDAFVDLLGGTLTGRSQLAASMIDIEAPTADKASQAVIQASGLTKQFGDFTAADDITFEIPRGEIFGLLGPNGAGKSTTFKMLCGLLRPTSGEGRVAGFDLRRDTAEARNHLGYMAQTFSLYGDLTIGQNLSFFAGVYGLRGRKKKQRIALMNEIFSFAPHAKMDSKSLPLGIQRRLSLACSVMHEPEALFLDEPTSGVDPITRREFWTHINGLVEKGVTVLVTTHFMDEAEYCDRICLIFRGRAIALGPPDELKSMAATAANPDPSMEDAFITLIEDSEQKLAA